MHRARQGHYSPALKIVVIFLDIANVLRLWDRSKHLAEVCPLEVINCSFSFAGCEAKLPRKDLPAHINDNLAVHMSLHIKSSYLGL